MLRANLILAAALRAKSNRLLGSFALEPRPFQVELRELYIKFGALSIWGNPAVCSVLEETSRYRDRSRSIRRACNELSHNLSLYRCKP